jgi:lipopolysaccharide transport system ATP-binding protein
MSDVVMRTVGLGKMFHIGGERQAYGTLRDTIAQGFKRPIERIRHPGAATHTSGEFWALRNIDLEVSQGDVLGIIGRNGAGKSTLLKVLGHITDPTEGRAEIRGRIGSLLEVGTGFHPELTGRENIYLNGSILGMKRAEINRRFDEIVEFSEIELFLDTPVKRYSSGMYVRLAFAVAAHLETDILIVDEVLAVGDIAFQKKCLGKMGAEAASGRTVLLVSHNMAAIEGLCSHASNKASPSPAARLGTCSTTT